MRAHWAIPCRFAEVNDNLISIIGGGIDHMWVPMLPTAVQLIVAVQLTGSPDEFSPDRTHEVRVVAYDPHLVELARVATALPPIAPPQIDWLTSLHLPLVVVFPAVEAGAYRISVSADDTEPYEVPMHVALAPGQS